MQERLEALEAEVKLLRKQNRQVKGWLLGAVLLAGLPYLLAAQWSAQTFTTVRAERFEVVMDGKVVATLTGIKLVGRKALGIYGEDRKPVAALGSYPNGGGFGICNKDGKVVASLVSAPNGGGLGIYNKDGKHIAGLAAIPTGGSLGIYNKDGKHIAGLAANSLGNGSLALWSSGGLLTFTAPTPPQMPTPFPPPPTFRTPILPQVYAGVGSGHWIKKVIDSGKYILLEDGSLWEVALLDRIDAALWLPFDDITVVENIGLYPYKLINTSEGETVEAKYMGGE